MDRQHRRDLKHDRFVDELGSLTTRARENQRVLFTATLGLVAVALIVYGIYFYRTNHERQAQDALSAAIESIDSPLIQAGAPANPLAKYKTEDERTSRSEAMFRDVQKKYPGTNAADVADLYLARLDASRGDVTNARKLLQSFIDEHPNHMLVGAARYSLYQLRIENGEAQQVIAELNTELGKAQDQVLPPDAILEVLSKAYESQGNTEQSKEALRKIIRQYPDSPYALEAQRRVGAAAT